MTNEKLNLQEEGAGPWFCAAVSVGCGNSSNVGERAVRECCSPEWVSLVPL